MKRIIRIALAGLCSVGLLAVAAPAGAANIGVFTGTATVTPALGLPAGLSGGPTSASWSISSTTPGGSCTDLNGSCVFSASGTVGSVGPVTPGCGISSGSGTGSFSGETLTSVGWITSAGTVIPINGTTASGKVLVGLVRAAPTGGPTGALACLSNNAGSFDVLGVAALLP